MSEDRAEGLDLEALKKVALAATQGEWEVQDGCSWRRIGTRGHNGNVICPTNHPTDRHPDLMAGRGEDIQYNLRHIATFDPPTVLKLIALAQHDQARPGVEQKPNKTMTINLTDDEVAELEALIEANRSKAPTIFRMTREWFERRAALEGDLEVGAAPDLLHALKEARSYVAARAATEAIAREDTALIDAAIAKALGDPQDAIRFVSSDEFTALASRPPTLPADGAGEAVLAIRDAEQAVISAARDMPRATPAPGGGGTVHMLPIEAAAIWTLDGALSALDRLKAHPSPPVASSAPVSGWSLLDNIGPTELDFSRPAPVSGDVEGLCARLERQGVLDIDDQDLTIAASTLRAQQAKITELKFLRDSHVKAIAAAEAKITEQDAEIEKYRAGYDALNEVLKGWQERSNANQERVRVLEAGLWRQCDNMAFALNRVDLPFGWQTKFSDELAQDRQALSESPNEK